MSTTQNQASGSGGAAALFAALPVVDQPTRERLHARLVERAEADRLVDVATRTIDTPLGPLLLAATDQGLVRVAFARQDHDAVLVALAEKISPRILSSPARLDTAAREMDEYFAGARTRFDVPLDYRLATGFRRQVLDHLPDISYGATASYAEVARRAGNPKAVRAVGTACGANPLPVVVPCHRVVRSDGAPGGYAGGPVAKRILLDLESR